MATQPEPLKDKKEKKRKRIIFRKDNDFDNNQLVEKSNAYSGLCDIQNDKLASEGRLLREGWKWKPRSLRSFCVGEELERTA